MRSRVLEPLAVVATGLLFLLFAHVLQLHGVFIGLAAAGWGTWLYLTVRRDPGALARWGFTRRNLGSCSVATTVVAGAGLLLMAAIGYVRGSLSLHPHVFPLLALYPLWGIGQQLLIQGLVAGNLDRGGVPRFAIVPICAVLFALVHVPDLEMVAATFLMGLAFTPIWLRWRNLWPLGVWHGWLGALCYFWVIGRDPWVEVFGG